MERVDGLMSEDIVTQLLDKAELRQFSVQIAGLSHNEVSEEFGRKLLGQPNS